MMKIKYNYKKIANKAVDMVKKRITELGLVATGTMRDSIKSNIVGDKINITGVDYFNDQDAIHSITDYVFSSKEFDDFVNDELFKQIEKQLDKQLLKKFK